MTSVNGRIEHAQGLRIVDRTGVLQLLPGIAAAGYRLQTLPFLRWNQATGISNALTITRLDHLMILAGIGLAGGRVVTRAGHLGGRTLGDSQCADAEADSQCERNDSCLEHGVDLVDACMSCF